MSLRRRFLNAVRLIGAENVIVVSRSNGRLPISSFPAAADTNSHESIIFVPTCGRVNATSYEHTVFMQLPSKRFLHWRPYSVFLDTNAHVAATSITNMGYGTRENTANKNILKFASWTETKSFCVQVKNGVSSVQRSYDESRKTNKQTWTKRVPQWRSVETREVDEFLKPVLWAFASNSSSYNNNLVLRKWPEAVAALPPKYHEQTS